ncbi:polysaccharide biosynthesis/export family protein [Actomonas aquatica]|uniref:Polysaccharide biosynthesis/export family protein n=1 Tax=Actomonas aquatica TaxID=2866162 RepID=A0ABZ1C9B1_9BACT|nr:polysaccharide biosynthesis/export family protein [Opitutus sp. WL0086]WRQ88101.1 polysaccharide biosynthesis/export family protein [Opitutus sp. WL0086]
MTVFNKHWLRRGLLLLTLLLVGQVAYPQPVPPAFRPGPNSRAITYYIALTDRLRVAVFQEEDLSTIVRVDAKGRVNLPLVGPIEVVGMTIEGAQEAIQNAYRDQRFLRNPQVTIAVEEYAAREVIVQGEVLQPGRIPLPIESGMTVLDAITKAGGLTDVARGEKVTVTRKLPDGTKAVTTVDVASILRGRDSSTDTDSSMLLLPDDIVFVPIRFL